MRLWKWQIDKGWHSSDKMRDEKPPVRLRSANAPRSANWPPDERGRSGKPWTMVLILTFIPPSTDHRGSTIANDRNWNFSGAFRHGLSTAARRRCRLRAGRPPRRSHGCGAERHPRRPGRGRRKDRAKATVLGTPLQPGLKSMAPPCAPHGWRKGRRAPRVARAPHPPLNIAERVGEWLTPM